MRYQFIFYGAAVEAFAFPQIFPWQKADTTSCAFPVVYTVIEYPYVVETWGPAVTQTITDVHNNTVTVTSTATQFLTTLTSTSTVGRSRSTSTRTVLKTIYATITLPGEVPSTIIQGTSTFVHPLFTSPSIPRETSPPSSPNISSSASPSTSSSIPACAPTSAITELQPIDTTTSNPAVTPPSLTEIIRPTSTTSPPKVPVTSSIAKTTPKPSCLPSTTDYPGVNNVPANTTWLLQLYYFSNGSPVPSNAYLTNTSSYTCTAADAVKVFLADGVLFALDPTYGVGWYATNSPAVDAPFALSQYLPYSGMTAKTFSFGPNWPYPLTWENCGFYEPPATFLYNQDANQIFVVFDGNQNQGVTHESIILGAVVPPV